MKKTILIAFELDDNNTGEDLDVTGSKFFQSLVLDKIKFNGVSITPVQINEQTLSQIKTTSQSILEQIKNEQHQ